MHSGVLAVLVSSGARVEQEHTGLSLVKHEHMRLLDHMHEDTGLLNHITVLGFHDRCNI